MESIIQLNQVKKEFKVLESHEKLSVALRIYFLEGIRWLPLSIMYL